MGYFSFGDIQPRCVNIDFVDSKGWVVWGSYICVDVTQKYPTMKYFKGGFVNDSQGVCNWSKFSVI